MKRVVAVLLLCLCGCFCSCGIASEDSMPTEYVGVWKTKGDTYDKAFPTAFELLSNGKTLIHYNESYDITQAPWLYAGEWFVSDERIIVYYVEDGCTQANVFYIKENGNLFVPKVCLEYTIQ